MNNNFNESYRLCLRDNLEICICDPDYNMSFLEDKVTDRIGDFAVYYISKLNMSTDGITKLIFRKQDLEYFGITHEQLKADAIKASLNSNMGLYSIDDFIFYKTVFYKFDVKNLTNLLYGRHDITNFTNPMFVLSNEDFIYGASLMIHESVREKIGRFIGSDYFILPSSVHEVIVVRDNNMPDEVDRLEEIVRLVNQDVITNNPDDFLSNHVQWCSKDGLCMVNARMRATVL